MTKEEIIAKVKKFQGANREFSQELPPIIDAMLDLIDEAGPEVVDNLESNSPTKALSAKQGKELKIMNDAKLSVPSVAGEAGQILQLDANAEPEWVTPASVGATYDSQADDTSTNAIQNKAIKKYVDDTKAAKDGYYASLTSGAAENLVGRGSVPATFLRRTTGGTADVGTGTAKIAKLMGNDIVWNQLANTSSLLSSGSNNGIDYTYADGVITAVSGTASATSFSDSALGNINVPLVQGHKYLLGAGGGTGNKYVQIFSDQAGYASYTTALATRAIFTCAESATDWKIRVRIASGVTVSNDKFVLNLFDLTKMFGSGKEPSTVAEFEALFPLDYYPYLAGGVRPFAAEKLVTTGFNQWDEVLEQGSIDGTTGQNISGSTYSRSKNYIPVFPSTGYYINVAAYIYGYDANKNYVWLNDSGANAFTTPANVSYIRFRQKTTDLPEHICINLSWSGYRNGEYEPYEKHELLVDPASWLDTDEQYIFPYEGMHGIGTARDFAIPDNDGYIRKATRVFGRVDLGVDLSWTDRSGDAPGVIAAAISVPYKKGLNLLNALCAKYTNFGQLDGIGYMSAAPDKSFAFYGGAGASFLLYLKDSDISAGDIVSGKVAKLNGIELLYELATPVEKTLLEPVAVSYYANDFGVESWEPQNTDEPYTAPCEVQISYNMNATDAIRNLNRNYMSVTSTEHLLTALVTAGILDSYTMTYDAEEDAYDFTLVKATEEDV